MSTATENNGAAPSAPTRSVQTTPATSQAIVRATPQETDDFRLALEPTNYADAGKMAALIASVGMFKVKSPADALVRIMTGRALGLPMFASLKGIFSTPDGAVGIESKLKVALCLARPDCDYFRCTERSMTKATYVAKRRGQEPFSLTFTIEEAEAAGLLDRGDTPEKKKANNWTRWRADMLMARASGRVADIVFPEASLGLPSREDLDDEMVGEVVTTSAASQLSAAPPAQVAPARDWEKESEDLKQTIADAKTPNDLKAARAMVAKFAEEAGEPWGSDLKTAYNTMTKSPASVQSPQGRPANRNGYLPPSQRGDSYEGPTEPEPPFGGP